MKTLFCLLAMGALLALLTFVGTGCQSTGDKGANPGVQYQPNTNGPNPHLPPPSPDTMDHPPVTLPN